MSAAPMIRAAFVLLALVSAASAAHANMLLTGAGGAPPAGCAQATAWITRAVAADASYDATHQAQDTTYICGLVTDGVITGDLSTTGCGAPLDLLSVAATQSAAVALLNMCGGTVQTHSSTLVANGSPTFTANRGYTGVDASGTVFLDTQINPRTGSINYVKDSAHLGIWSLTNAASSAGGGVTIGVSSDPTPRNNDFVYAKYSDGNTYCGVDDGANDTGAANANSTGLYICNRTSLSNIDEYKNSSLLRSAAVTSTDTPNGNVYVLAENDVGVGGSSGSALQIAFAIMGSQLTSGNVTAIYTRTCTLLLARGAVGSC